MDVYGSASEAHIYGSTNLLLDSDAAINIFSSPRFGLALQSPVPWHGQRCAPSAGIPGLGIEGTAFSSSFRGLHMLHPPPSLGLAVSPY